MSERVDAKFLLKRLGFTPSLVNLKSKTRLKDKEPAHKMTGRNELE